MRSGGVYKVTGRLAYSGYQPGETFMAVLEPVMERRAIMRGNIRLLERVQPSLPPGCKLPAGWADPPREV